MLKNYWKIAMRLIRKQKGYAFINIMGLSLGLAACALILLYVRDDLSYDRHHEHAEQIYRVNLKASVGGSPIDEATSSAPIGATLVAEYPEVVQAARLLDAGRSLMSYDEKRFYEEHFLWADSTIFDVFTLPLVAGDPRSALHAPNTVVLTESMARKYFGTDDPLGKTLQLNGQTAYRVTGVLKDPPLTSHVTIDFLGSLSTLSRSRSPIWVSHSYYTYLLLNPEHTPETLEAKFPALIRKYVAPQIEEALGQSYDEAIASGLEWAYYLEPLTQIHLHSVAESQLEPVGNIQTVYLLSVIALLILVLACINFMNLSTARSSNRAKEVGLRKVLGSMRKHLIYQFLGEAVMLSLTSGLLAFITLLLLLPVFADLTGKTLALGASDMLTIFSGILGIALVAGLLAGLYPAFVLSRFRPAQVLKGDLSLGARSGTLRSTLVVVQFAASIMLLVATAIVYNQIDFMLNKRLGFSQEQVVVISIQEDTTRQRFEALRETLLQNTRLSEVAAASHVPGRIRDVNVFRPEGSANDAVFPLWTARVSYDFLNALEMEVVAGRGFSRVFATDSAEAFVINETAARLMNLTPEEAVGKTFAEVGNSEIGDDVGTIIGVVKDFHFQSLHQPIEGLAMNVWPDAFQYAVARVAPRNLDETLDFLQQQWSTFEPAYPFEFFFLDADFAKVYAQDQKLSQIVSLFAVLAVVIACLGLFGLASFLAEQRTKEIGVRKVLGASVTGIILLLSKDFARLVLIAFVVAVPLSYLAMDRWLQDFAYRVDISWSIFACVGLAALGVALLTVSYQSIKAALADPVKSLRY